MDRPHPSPSPLPRRRRWWWVVLVQALLFLGLAELTLHLFRPHHGALRALFYLPSEGGLFDDAQTLEELLGRSYFGYHPGGITPGFILNSRGFRTAEYTWEPRPGTLRMVALGDSFTFSSSGVPIASMWHRVAGREIARQAQREVEVINLGVTAVGPRFVLRLWQLEGRHLYPSLVVLGLFVGNDLTDEAGALAQTTGPSRLVRWSLVARLARNLWRVWREPSPVATSAAELSLPESVKPEMLGTEVPGYEDLYDPQAPAFSEETYLELEASRLEIFRRDHRETFETLLAGVVEAVEQLDVETRAAGARLTVMIIPDELQVNDDLYRKLLDHLTLSPADVDRDLPQLRLADELSARGIAYVDVLPALRRAAVDELVYRPLDSHWTDAGNRVAGEELARVLLRR